MVFCGITYAMGAWLLSGNSAPKGTLASCLLCTVFPATANNPVRAVQPSHECHTLVERDPRSSRRCSMPKPASRRAAEQKRKRQTGQALLTSIYLFTPACLTLRP